MVLPKLPADYRNSSLQLAGHLFLGFGAGAGRSGVGLAVPRDRDPVLAPAGTPLAWPLVPTGGDALSLASWCPINTLTLVAMSRSRHHTP